MRLRHKLGLGGFIAFMVVSTLVEIAIVVGIVYVAIHFIAKFW